MKLNTKAVGTYCAILFGGAHAFWALLVAFGWAQGLLDWVLSLHFISPVYTVTGFKVGTAFFLVLFTTIIGYMLGYYGSIMWNRMEK